MKNLIKVLLFAGVYFLMAIPATGEPPTGINLGHDYTFNLVTGNLTSDGVQYSTVVSTVSSGVDVTMFSEELDLDFGNTPARTASHKFIIDLYFEIRCEYKANSTATADVEWKPQVRNKDGTWTDLVAAYVDLADVNTTYTASVLKGYFTLTDNIDEIPLDFRILMKCDETNEGMGRLKNGSYIRVTFKDITWGVE